MVFPLDQPVSISSDVKSAEPSADGGKEVVWRKTGGMQGAMVSGEATQGLGVLDGCQLSRRISLTRRGRC